MLIEVNPRHVRYYERMLGFKVIGSERLNRSVRAPAVLLMADFSYIMAQVGEFGGQPERAATERSLYPFVFSLQEKPPSWRACRPCRRPATSRTARAGIRTACRPT